MTLDILRRNNVKVFGRGTQPMLFAHGFGCDQNMWRFITPAFEDDYRIVLFDYVGSGKSDLAAYDAAALRDARRLRAATCSTSARRSTCEDVIFVGHSVSAMVGVLAANQEPERFARLVLIGPSPRYVNDRRNYVGGFERSDIEGLLETMDKNYIGWANYLAPSIMKNPERPELEAELTESFCSTDPVIARRFAEATFFADNRADLAALTCHRSSCSAPRTSSLRAKSESTSTARCAGSTLRVMEATGHCPHMSAPDETIALMKEYLATPGTV